MLFHPNTAASSVLVAGRMEKYILRKAFDTPENPYLPAHVLWRQKEQFSDGVGYSWIDGLKEHANNVVSDQMLATAQHRWACKIAACLVLCCRCARWGTVWRRWFWAEHSTPTALSATGCRQQHSTAGLARGGSLVARYAVWMLQWLCAMHGSWFVG
jgi:asparagine synthetase B (glutamine-hydrolysing)